MAGGDQSYLLQVTRRAMAADFQVLLNAGEYGRGPDLAPLRRRTCWSRWNSRCRFTDRPAGSSFCLNARAFLAPQRVELRLFYLLRRAVDLHRQTFGAFEITAGPLARVLGFHQRQGRRPTDAEIVAAQSGGSQHLQLNEGLLQVQYLRKGLEINLGGIGKGFALDRCGSVGERGIESFLVQGGLSSVAARGMCGAGKATAARWSGDIPWPPAMHRRLAAPRRRFRDFRVRQPVLLFHEGKRYGHILDPRNGYPADQVHSASVIADNAANRRAGSQPFYIMGPRPRTTIVEPIPRSPGCWCARRDATAASKSCGSISTIRHELRSRPPSFASWKWGRFTPVGPVADRGVRESQARRRAGKF